MAITQDDGSRLEGSEIPVRRMSPRDHVTIHTTEGIYQGTVKKENGGASPSHETKTVKLHTQDLEGDLKLEHRVTSNETGSSTRLGRIKPSARGGTTRRSLGRVEKIVLDGHAPFGRQGGDA